MEDLEIDRLYSDITKNWKPKDDNWWEVISDVEFLMLRGEVTIALSKLNDFLDFNKLENLVDDISATIRQLDMYIHFTNDTNAITVRKNIQGYLDNR